MSSVPFPMMLASGQAVALVGLLPAAIVKVNSAVVPPNADGSYPVPAGVDAIVTIEQGGRSVSHTVRVAATEVRTIDLRPDYPWGTPDFIKNAAAINKFQMGVFSLSVLAGVLGGAIAAMKD